MTVQELVDIIKGEGLDPNHVQLATTAFGRIVPLTTSDADETEYQGLDPNRWALLIEAPVPVDAEPPAR